MNTNEKELIGTSHATRARGIEQILPDYGYSLKRLSKCMDVRVPAIRRAIQDGSLRATMISGKYIVWGENALKWISGRKYRRKR